MTPVRLAEQFGLELFGLELCCNGRVYKDEIGYSLFETGDEAYSLLFGGDLDFLAAPIEKPSLGFKISMSARAVPSAMYILIKGI